MKYKKRPIVTEAIQFFGKENVDKVEDWMHDHFKKESSNMLSYHYSTDKYYLSTSEGTFSLSEGDWIIKGVKGEVYPCKDKIFKLTYDPVDIPSFQGRILLFPNPIYFFSKVFPKFFQSFSKVFPFFLWKSH